MDFYCLSQNLVGISTALNFFAHIRQACTRNYFLSKFIRIQVQFENKVLIYTMLYIVLSQKFIVKNKKAILKTKLAGWSRH